MTRKKPPDPQAPAAAPTEAAPPPPEGAEPPPADGPSPGAKPTGRPSSFTQETADAICALLAEGLPLRQICRDPEMPGERTVYSWLAALPAFRQQYALAREAQMDRYAEEIIEIADDGSNDWMEREGKDGGIGYALNGEHIARSRERIDARKWLMGKLAPKKYGDKLQLSNDPDAPFGDKHLTVIEVKGQLLEGLGLKKVTDGTGG